MMVAFNAMPRRGHLEAVFHIFAYLNSHLRSFLVLDNSYVDVPLAVKPDWTDFYPDVKEELPPLTFLKCFDFIVLMLCQQ
jgi:hypothetical protein